MALKYQMFHVTCDMKNACSVNQKEKRLKLLTVRNASETNDVAANTSERNDVAENTSDR